MGVHQWEFKDLLERYRKEKNPSLKQKQEKVILEHWDTIGEEGDVFIESHEAREFGIEFQV